MGSAKDEMMEREEEKRDRELANVLGISYDELIELDHFVESNTNDDGMDIGTIVSLNNATNKKIIDKLKYKPDSIGKIYLDRFAFPTGG